MAFRKRWDLKVSLLDAFANELEKVAKKNGESIEETIIRAAKKFNKRKLK